MQTYTHINEDFLDAIDSEELKTKDSGDVCKADIMDPYFEFTLFIFHNVDNPKLETDLYHVRRRFSKLIDMTFADNMRSEMLTITYDIVEKTERKIGWMTSDYTEHKFIENNIQEITQDLPTVVTCASFNTSKSFTPQMMMRFFTVVSQILLKMSIDDVCVVRNRIIHEIKFIPSLLISDTSLTDYMYSPIRKQHRSLDVKNTDEIVTVTTAFNNVYNMSRDYFFRNDPMTAAMKAVPQFEPSLAMMIQVKQMIEREIQILPKNVVRLKDFDITINIADYKSLPMCYEFSGDLTAMHSWGKQNNFTETKKLGTGFTPEHCADIIKPYYNNTKTVSDAYYMTLESGHNNHYIPKHFLFCYLGTYFEDYNKWPYYGGCLISANTKSELEKLIKNTLP